MIAAVVLSFLRWNGLGTPHWAGGSNWAQFFHDPVARQSLIVTAKVIGLSWVVQTPISMALGLFTAGRQRYRSVYAAHLRAAAAAVHGRDRADVGGAARPELRRAHRAVEVAAPGLPAAELAGQRRPHPVRDGGHHRLAVHPVPHAALPGGPPADPGCAVRGRAPWTGPAGSHCSGG